MACGQLWIDDNIPFHVSSTLKQPSDPGATWPTINLSSANLAKIKGQGCANPDAWAETENEQA